MALISTEENTEFEVPKSYVSSVGPNETATCLCLLIQNYQGDFVKTCNMAVSGNVYRSVVITATSAIESLAVRNTTKRNQISS